MRKLGVVGTRVGYTQGIVNNPTYEAVCTGKTHHREAIIIIYDPEILTYTELLQVALERLAATKVPMSSTPSDMYLDMFSEDSDERTSKQYRHGFYYHSEEQREIARRELEVSNPYDIELKKAAAFYDAEEYHQQYLLKGGQTAKKGAKETIRCFG
jgi:peptide-methionine (S)-S-oxide reductase